MHLTKTYEGAEFKALDRDKGTFEAIVSVFGNVDLIGDRVVKGAFERNLKEWEASGDPIPVVFSHRWDDLDSHIGKVLQAEERDEGLWVKGQLDMEDEDARKVWRLMSDRRIKEFSFAYNVRRERPGDDGANELVDLDIIEVGPTLKGMNPATELLAVKAGRVISKANESKIKTAITALEEVLVSLKETPPEEEKAVVEAEADNGKASDDSLLELKARIASLDT